MGDEDEEFDPYHVPQQRRRDKLRLLSSTNSNLLFQPPAPFLPNPIYHHQHNNNSNSISSSSSHFLPGPVPDCLTRLATSASATGGCCGGPAAAASCSTLSVKEEEELLGAALSNSNSNSNPNPNLIYMMMDPRSSSSSSTNNPTSSFQEIQQHNNPFHLYNPQNLRFLNACHNHHGGLSLSLSTVSQQQQQQQQLPLELNLQNDDYSGKIGSFGGGSTELSRNLVVPLGPFTGYASVLKGSRFLRPAEKLLEEICEGIMYVEKMSDMVFLDQSSSTMEYDDVGGRRNLDDVVSQSCNLGRNKSRLMSMLNEVYKRYKQYCHQMQAVVSSFESVAGVKNAAPFASMALKSMSKHFSCLRNAISDQLQFLSEPTHDNNNNNNNIGAPPPHVTQEKDAISPPGFDTAAAAASGMLEFVQQQPVWRPQRGLPERAVTILRAWLFDHFLHPYPTDTDKLMLAKQTGLSRSQVSNWFINARVRLWKPMVEEIHMLETRQAQKSSNEMADKEKDHLVPDSSVITTPSTSRIQDISLKRARKETTASVMENAMDRNYMDELSSVPRLGLGGGGSGGVSLTLGLEQNNGSIIGRLADPFSLSAARRLGLVDPNGEEYHVGGGGVWH